MWFFKSAEQKKLESTIDAIAYFIVEELRSKGLISLYLAGSILDEEERNVDSDIDIFGIVNDDFDFTLEDRLNRKMLEYVNSICDGHETRFKAFTIGSLKGLNDEGHAVKIFRPERIVQKFRYFKFLWGEKFDFSEDFIKPMKLEDEAYFLMEQLSENIEAIKEGREQFPIKDFPKMVVELVRVEAELFYGFKYHPSRVKLQKFLQKYTDNIIHTAMALRKNLYSRNEITGFADQVESYIQRLKEKMEK